MKKIIKKIKEKNKREFVFRGGIVLLLVFLGLMPKIAHAGPIDWLLGAIEGTTVDLIAVVASFFVDLIGILVSMVVYSIVAFSNYNNFIHEEAIKHAWEIIVSFCNMFFILILLVIAFANILNIDSYKIKNTLPKVVIMAVLINFSLMICGLLIDFSQIFMMTFVNALGTSGGSFINTLGVNEYFAIVKKQKAITKGTELDVASAALGMAMTVVFMFISLIVLVCVLVIIIMRIMLLWAYSVLSPFAFLLSAFPAGKAWASKWWDRFTKELIVGPVLMFFVWFAFYLVGEMGNFSAINQGGEQCFGPIDILCPGEFLNFFMAIAMLIGGLKVAQEIGGVTGGVAGKAIGRIQQGKDLTTKGLKTGTKALAGFGADKIQEKGWGDLNLARVYRGIQEKRAEKKQERYATGMQASQRAMAEGGRLRGALAMTGTPGTAWEHITSAKGLRQRLTGGKRMKTKKAETERELDSLQTERNQLLSPEEKKNLEER